MTRHPSRALSSCGRVAPHLDRVPTSRRPPAALDRRRATMTSDAVPDGELLDVVTGPFERQLMPRWRRR